MKITRKQLRKLISESLEGDEEIEVTDADVNKIKIFIRTLDAGNIKQAAFLAKSLKMKDEPYRALVQHTIAELIDSKWKIADQIESDVLEHIQKIVKNNLGMYLHNDESNVFYLEDDNKASALSERFYVGVTGSIINYIENYLVETIIAIGDE